MRIFLIPVLSMLLTLIVSIVALVIDITKKK